MTDEPTEDKRVRFSSRIAFYFAAVGSAVGFGNIWRFPQLAADYGGGAFLIPYVMALVLIGIPIMFLELSLGQFYQTGDVGSFGSIHKRLRGIGLSSVACACMLVGYYTMLISWVMNAFFNSFGDDNPWKEGLDGQGAVDYFFNTIIGQETLGNGREHGRPTRLVWANVGYSFMSWFIIFICLAFGLKWTGRITYFTMGFPVLLLFIFLGKACSLPGSEDGIKEYIGIWDMTVLRDEPAVWSRAVSQIFFSLGITFGIMTAYGSHVKKDEPVLLNTVVIASANCMFSFIAGFAVFAAIGHLAYLEETELSKVTYDGFGLVFGTWPVVMNTLPGGIHWVRLLFLNLFLLGIDSAFAILEAALTVVKDSKFGENVSVWKMTAIACFLGWSTSLYYATDAGLNFLDVVDFYINFAMLAVGGFEAFSAGWIYGIEKSIEKIGLYPVLLFMAGNFVSVTVATICWLEANAWSGFVAWIIIYGGCLAVSLTLIEDMSINDKLYELLVANVFDLREMLMPVVGTCPKIWAIFMRHFIPQVITILFINLAASENDIGEPQLGHYGKYTGWPYQALGIICMCLIFVLVLVGAIWPDLYAPLHYNPEEEKTFQKKLDAETPEEEVSGDDAVEAETPATKEVEPVEVDQ